MTADDGPSVHRATCLGPTFTYRTSHGWYFCSFVHRDMMRNLSRAVGTNLPAHKIELLQKLGTGMSEVQIEGKFRRISGQLNVIPLSRILRFTNSHTTARRSSIAYVYGKCCFHILHPNLNLITTHCHLCMRCPHYSCPSLSIVEVNNGFKVIVAEIQNDYKHCFWRM